MSKIRQKLAILLMFLLVYLLIFQFLTKDHGYLVIEPVTLPSTNNKLAEKIKEFPSLIDAIKSGKEYFGIDISIEDYKELFWEVRNGSYIKIDGTYYHVSALAFAGVEELNQSNGIQNLNTELQKFRPINLSLHSWKIEKDEDGKVFYAEAGFNEVLAIEELIKEGNVLEYENRHFRTFLKARVAFNIFLDPERCIQLDGKIDNFPLLKKGLEEAEKIKLNAYEGEIDNIGSVEAGGVKIRIAVGEMNRIANNFGYFECVRYNNSFFRVVLAKPCC
jgi:hypothetical protein